MVNRMNNRNRQSNAKLIQILYNFIKKEQGEGFNTIPKPLNMFFSTIKNINANFNEHFKIRHSDR